MLFTSGRNATHGNLPYKSQQPLNPDARGASYDSYSDTDPRVLSIDHLFFLRKDCVSLSLTTFDCDKDCIVLCDSVHDL